MTRQLPSWHSVLAVVAHPDDESFGLGAVLSELATRARVSVLCCTHGEASSVHGVPGDLRTVREAELRAGARELGAEQVILLDHPDGRLADVALDILSGAIVAAAGSTDAQALLVFDTTGVTGHPDHRAATAAACEAARRLGLPVLAWTIPAEIADTLNSELQTTFAGQPESLIDIALPVDRRRQRAAVACHASQAVPTSVLWRRLELLADTEYLRWLRRPGDTGYAVATIRERESAALAALQNVSGDASLCALSRSGRPYPAVKYHEGAVSALAELRRSAGPDRLVDLSRILAVRDRWHARAEGTAPQAADWQAYYAGGLEALDGLVDAGGPDGAASARTGRSAPSPDAHRRVSIRRETTKRSKR